jgi:hypothetical protein
MTYEEHTALIREIRESATDEGKLSTLLTQLSDDYNSTLGTVKETTDKNTELTQANESLRESNMKLFLKIGQEVKPEENKTPEDTKKSFEKLFDEKGELK